MHSQGYWTYSLNANRPGAFDRGNGLDAFKYPLVPSVRSIQQHIITSLVYTYLRCSGSAI